MTMRRSHFCISSLAHSANLSGSASPKKTMSVWGEREGRYCVHVCEGRMETGGTKGDTSRGRGGRRNI